MKIAVSINTEAVPDAYKALPLSMVAALLKVSPRTVERLIAKGEIQCIKVGGSRRVLKNDLRAYLDASRSQLSAC